ncbi:hypothetical protein L873DRAFT_1786158 [Choiromyces venosus 120613-1]|uniref:Uncharacterized protein n=1 Tax=Choiromyces venosus 120613-1 TaxID=1336337 RepID=A0A3N4K569_9PEZI|nr:hypothetical protein L873DRAFT_1786158 [Choiromyces venosus 120613-1]
MPASTESLRVDEDSYPVASDFTPSSSAFAKLPALIADENKPLFSITAHLQTKIKVKIKECLESETGCYMLVTDVPGHIDTALYEALEKRAIHKVARFTYEQIMQSVIFRVMPGAPHEVV